MSIAPFLRRLRDDCAGTMLIETAIVAPMLIMMALAGVEVSQMVLRQHELQAAASKVTEITLVAPPANTTDLANLKNFIVTSAKVKPESVSVTFNYRCNGTSDFHLTSTGCTDKPKATTHVSIVIFDQYTPVWATLGYGEAFTFQVRRKVQIS